MFMQATQEQLFPINTVFLRAHLVIMDQNKICEGCPQSIHVLRVNDFAFISDHLLVLLSFPFSSSQILGCCKMNVRDRKGYNLPDTKFKSFEVCMLNVRLPGPLHIEIQVNLVQPQSCQGFITSVVVSEAGECSRCLKSRSIQYFNCRFGDPMLSISINTEDSSKRTLCCLLSSELPIRISPVNAKWEALC